MNNTLDKLLNYYEQSSIDYHSKISGVNNFNNVETADRKLIINNKLEFWVHDHILNDNCNYFYRLQDNKENKEENDNDIFYNGLNKSYKRKNLENDSTKNYMSSTRTNKFKQIISAPNENRNFFSKQNTRYIHSRMYGKNRYTSYYSQYNSLTSKNSNFSISFDDKKFKKNYSIDLRKRYDNIRDSNIINKSILINKKKIKEDLIKIKRLKEIITQRKITLGLINDKFMHKERSTGNNNRTKADNFYINYLRKYNYEKSNNKTDNTTNNNIDNNTISNIIMKKNYLHTIVRNRDMISRNKKINLKKINNNNGNIIYNSNNSIFSINISMIYKRCD